MRNARFSQLKFWAWTGLLVVTSTSLATAADKPADVAEEWRARYRKVIRQSSPRELLKAKGSRTDAVIKVSAAALRLHLTIGDADVLSFRERTRMKGHLEARLQQLQQRLKREKQRTARDTDSRSRTRASLQAGSELERAQELIDLIQQTICPDSWDVNGGNGSIKYFQPLHVLVVRTTSQGHDSVAEALPKLRP